MEILLRFPELPAAARASVSWILVYPESVSADIPFFNEISAPAGCDETALSLARGINLPVLAYPVFDLGRGRKVRGGFPAASFFPLDLDDTRRLQLSWESGAAAEIIRCCSLSSPLYRGFDISRFREVLAAKAVEEAGGDLWMIDPEPILCRLGYGIFRESAVRTAEVMEFQVPVLGGGYASDNPFLPEAEVQPGGVLQVSVPINKKTAFIGEGGEIISVYFNNSLWCWSNSATGAGESGRR
ncbi:MAG: hypothetical protein JEZ04_13045 [Spirochaetales bacterium]|nr:hypothetical protein [Spirochaetales bacterium]